MAKDEKTEKATPKRRQEARKKGQVAKSTDLGGALDTGVDVEGKLHPDLLADRLSFEHHLPRERLGPCVGDHGAGCNGVVALVNWIHQRRLRLFNAHAHAGLGDSFYLRRPLARRVR